jgi:molecular chaperone DnaJ
MSIFLLTRPFATVALCCTFSFDLTIPISNHKTTILVLTLPAPRNTKKDDNNAADKFKEATEAYETLSDEKQRGLYDQFGHAGVDPNYQSGNPFGGQAGGQNPFSGFDFGDGSFHFSSSQGGPNEIDPEELFDAFFGGGRRRKPRGPRRGADLQMHVRLTFKEAVFGSSQDLDLRYQTVDSKTGKVELKERTVTVDTPPGIDHGMNLRLSGQGADGDPGAPRGNLLVQVLVEDDAYFQRDGADVHTEIPISFTQAVLGGTVDVETLTGQVEVKIPKGCQPDTKLLLRGKGIQKLHSASRGSQVVHLKIQIPKEVTSRQEQLLREFDDETASSGKGISGRLAEAAGSAFEKIFGSKDSSSHSAKKKGDKKERKAQDASATKGEEEDGVEDETKQAAR